MVDIQSVAAEIRRGKKEEEEEDRRYRKKLQGKNIMAFTLNFHEFLHTVYKYVLNSVVKISLMFAQHFEYYAIILRGPLFVGTMYVYGCKLATPDEYD